VPLGWVLDCFVCGRAGHDVLTQDPGTGELVGDDGVRAHELTCAGCGADELLPMLVAQDRQYVRPFVVPA
jgi:hypothetical protein